MLPHLWRPPDTGEADCCTMVHAAKNVFNPCSGTSSHDQDDLSWSTVIFKESGISPV